MKLFEALFAVGLALVAVWIVVSIIRKGMINGEDGYTLRRVDQPNRFWLEIAVGIICIIGAAVIAYLKVSKL